MMIKVIAGAALLVAALPIQAKPYQAAEVTKGDICIVTDALGDQQFDYACSAHFVEKRDANDVLISLNYHDQGQLQPGQVAPSSATQNPIDYVSSGGLTCTGQEVIKPNGNYSSTLNCR